MATHFRILAWKIPQTESGGPQSTWWQSQTWLSARAHVYFLAVLSLCRCAGFFLVVAGAPSSSGAWAFTALVFLLQSTGSRHTGFSSCGVWSQRLWCSGLVAPLHVGSS